MVDGRWSSFETRRSRDLSPLAPFWGEGSETFAARIFEGFSIEADFNLAKRVR